jgi:transforming growth factor-beta-induced protein
MLKLLALAASLAVAAAQQQTIADIIAQDPELRMLTAAVTAGGLLNTFNTSGTYTLFAPIDQGFFALGDNILDYVLNPDNQNALDTVLTYHALGVAVPSSKITDGQQIATLDNKLTVTAHVGGGQVHINNALVLRANVQASNGIIHVLDNVLVPSNFNYPKSDIVQTAIATSALSTLVTAVKAANLVDALSYPHGPFTVFAPSDDAFNNLPAGTLQYLLAHPQELAQVLLYHVIDARGDYGSGRLYADEIKNFEEVFTLDGQSLIFVLNGGKVLVNGNATVIIPNVDCSNGVVHVIDSVLLPNAGQLAQKVAAWNKKNVRGSVTIGALPNLVQLAESVPQLSTLVTAVKAGGLVNALSGPGPLTVFAPTNDAFARLPGQFLNYLLSNITALDEVLTYHVVSGNVTSSQLYDGELVPTLEGANITVHKDPRGAIFVDFAQVIAPNNFASNGVAHIIDAVILPVGYQF